MTEALVAEEQEYLGKKDSDPLIDLKQQELTFVHKKCSKIKKTLIKNLT